MFFAFIPDNTSYLVYMAENKLGLKSPLAFSIELYEGYLYLQILHLVNTHSGAILVWENLLHSFSVREEVA